MLDRKQTILEHLPHSKINSAKFINILSAERIAVKCIDVEHGIHLVLKSKAVAKGLSGINKVFTPYIHHAKLYKGKDVIVQQV